MVRIRTQDEFIERSFVKFVLQSGFKYMIEL
jgi:hypothetical protein